MNTSNYRHTENRFFRLRHPRLRRQVLPIGIGKNAVALREQISLPIEKIGIRNDAENVRFQWLYSSDDFFAGCFLFSHPINTSNYSSYRKQVFQLLRHPRLRRQVLPIGIGTNAVALSEKISLPMEKTGIRNDAENVRFQWLYSSDDFFCRIIIPMAFLTYPYKGCSIVGRLNR